MNELTSYQVVEDLGKAIALMSSSNTIAHDKTIVGKILGRHETKSGCYWVSNGSMRFEAKALNNQQYFITDSQVYVLIPNGDYSQEKIITGKYNDHTTSEMLSKNSFDNFTISYSSLLVDALTTNITNVTNTAAGSKTITELSIPQQRQFDYVGFDFSLDTLAFLNQDIPTKSEYHIEIKFSFSDLEEPIIYTIKDVELIGNPLAMFPAIKHQHLFAWNKNLNAYKISEITCSLLYSAEQPINAETIGLKLLNVNLHFGYAKDNLPKNSLELELADPETTNLYYEKAQASSYEKEVVLNWYYQPDNETDLKVYNKTSVDLPQDCEVIWLKYDLRVDENADGILGALHWRRPEENTEIILLNRNQFSPVLVITGSYASEERYKVYIRFKDAEGVEQIISSNEIIFSAYGSDSYNFVSGDPLNTSSRYTGVIIGNDAVQKQTSDGTNSFLSGSGIYSYVNGDLTVQIDNKKTRIADWNLRGNIMYSDITKGKDDDREYGTGFMGTSDYNSNPFFYAGYDPKKEKELNPNSNGLYPSYNKNWVDNGVVKAMITRGGFFETSAGFNFGVGTLSTNPNAYKTNNTGMTYTLYYKGAEVLNTDKFIVSTTKPKNPYENMIWIQPV